MKRTLRIVDRFGTFCADGQAAVQFRRDEIDPYVGAVELIELDFTGVQNANSSFCNSLMTGYVVRHSPDAISHLRFVGCRPHLRVMLSAALELGVRRWNQERTLAGWA